jgi:GTP-binding protein
MRNIAIIAHVDHGKTTLVDAMLQIDGQVASGADIGKDDRLMDSNDQEKERGITILAKNCAVNYKGTKINIVDTPGHADFGGEVERVLGMVDAVLLLVDAQEGPKPQTRFVLKKAIQMGHKILVVVNKIDKPAARPDYVLDKTFDLFCELGASDEQTDFPVVYASAINRIAGNEPGDEMVDMDVLFQKIMELPKPACDQEGPLQLQISSVSSDNFIGRLGIGRIRAGTVKKGSVVGLSAGPGSEVKQVKVGELFNFDALGRAPITEAAAGEIVVFSGISDFNIGDTVVSLDDPRPLEPLEVEVPTMSMTFGVNKAPFAGKVGKLLTTRQIKDRLDKELETNVALKVSETDDADKYAVSGRGLLHLTVLIETMRREGFEMMVGCPQVIEQEIDGERMEPFEMVDIDVPDEYSGSVISLLNNRKGNMINMGSVSDQGMVGLQYEMPSRGMNGVKSALLSITRGLMIMTSTFAGYKPYAGDFAGRTSGNLFSVETGTVTSYSIAGAPARGVLFCKAGDEIYENQIIGISSRDKDLGLNVCKTKALTNMRAAGSDEVTKLVPPKALTLEDAVEYIVDGEYVEVTPDAIRIGIHPKLNKNKR